MTIDPHARPRGPILVVSLVHPDLLPSLYSVAEVLTDNGAEVHIVSFSSPVSGTIPLRDHIHLHDFGPHRGGMASRAAARWSFRRQLDKWMRKHKPVAILAACPFGYLEALRVRAQNTPVVFLFYEMYDTSMRSFRGSPATATRTWRALRRLGEATLICTPSSERAAWLVGRARLHTLPATVLNSPASGRLGTPTDNEALARLLPSSVSARPFVINTGGVTASRGVVEPVASVEYWESDASLVVTNVEPTAYGAEVRRLASASRRRDDIILLPLLPRADMLALQRTATVGTSLLSGGDNLDTMFPAPNKIAEYVSAGLLVVTSRSSFTERLADRGIAELVETLEPRDIARVIDIALKRTARADIRSAALLAARDWYCMDVQLRPVLKALGYA